VVVSHPEKQRLVDYASGKLAKNEADDVAGHLSQCPECEATIDTLEPKADTMVSGLREKPAPDPYAKEADLKRAMDRAANLPARPEQAAEKSPPTKVSTKSPPKLGPYQLIAKLGEGGMGAVFKAQHEHLGKTVAIKILPRKAMQDPAAVARFRREMKAVGGISHPNIVGAHDGGEAQGMHYLVMEYVAGHDLSSLTKKQGPLPLDKAISYIRQAACGLTFAHSKGIVHRDIKPANLLVDTEGTLKILDLGLARLESDQAVDAAANDGLTQTGQVMGTVDYMAPEQAFDTHRADAKADVYSLGCTLYRIVTGRNAYGGDTVVQKILAHREHPIPSLVEARPEAPAALGALYQRMMAKRPEDRPTMAEVVKELEAVQTEASRPSEQTDAWSASGGGPVAHASEVSMAWASSPLRALDVPEILVEPTRKLKTRGAKGPPSKNRNVLVGAAAAGGAALILCGIWVIFKQGDKEVGRAYIENADRVEVAHTNPPHSPAPNPRPPAPASSPPLAIAPFDATQAKAYQAAWAKHLGTQVETTNSVGIRLTLIPPGEFLMGSTPEQVAAAKKMGEDDKMTPNNLYFSWLPDEMPLHAVTISQPFLVGSTEVTVAQFRKFAEASNYITEAEKDGFQDKAKEAGKQKNWKRPEYSAPLTDETAVTYITWNDACAYCAWLSEQEQRQPWYRADGRGGWLVAARADGYRLPTEAEWEYACRAGTTTQYSCGDDKSQLEQYGWFVNNQRGGVQPVALKLPNPFGLFDMHGNAMEWCQDSADGKWYEKSPPTDPKGPSYGFIRVLRGGSWPYEASRCRSAFRGHDRPSYRFHTSGFRVVRPLDASKANPPSPLAGEGPGVRGAGLVPASSPSPQPSPVKGEGVKGWQTPEFDRWVKATQALPAEKQIEAVGKKLMELNPEFDGSMKHRIVNGEVIELRFASDNVTDISPVRALPRLERLACNGSQPYKGKLSDLSPLAGMKLTWLDCGATKVSDLSPLRGMPLTSLYCGVSPVADLSPLAGMPLGHLNCSSSPVADLSPLHGMPLNSLDCYGTNVSDLSPLVGSPLATLSCGVTAVTDVTPVAGMNLKAVYFSPKRVTRGIEVLRPMKSLVYMSVRAGDRISVEEFWKRYDAGEFDKSSTDINDPAFQQWIAGTQKLPAEKQVDAVMKKLMVLNRGFDGKNQNQISGGVVTRLDFSSEKVTDLSPVRALAGLTYLRCGGTAGPRSGSIRDLSPLAGLKLTQLYIRESPVVDLSPLAGMPLVVLVCDRAAVADLSPLAGMPLEELVVTETKVSSLDPLRGMQLKRLEVAGAEMSDLSPLAGMPIKYLRISSIKATNFSPLAAMPLVELRWYSSPITDASLEVLKNKVTLTHLSLTGDNQITDGALPVLESLTGLQTLEVTKTKITPAGVERLKKALPKCEIAGP
jgi:serine/threonine protein kinase/Leucine-rich repeat (LRR) protein